MIETRVLHFSNENGSKEGVYFTQDMDIAAEEIAPDWATETKDSKIEDDMPPGFPLEYLLIRS